LSYNVEGAAVRPNVQRFSGPDHQANEPWSYPFDNRWTDLNPDWCVNTVDERTPTTKTLVYFGPVIPEISWLICVGCDCREANIRTVLVKGHLLGGSSIASL